MSVNFYDREYYKADENTLSQSCPEKKRELKFLKGIIYPGSGKKLLEVGCGTGGYLKTLDNSGADLWGIDISEIATNVAKKNVAKSDQIICDNACPLPFGDNEFDYVTAWGTVEHFPSTLAIIKEIRRVSKQGSQIAIMVPNAYYYKFIWDTLRKGTGPVRHQEIEFLHSFKEWKDIIEKSGLLVTRVFRHNKFNKHPIFIWLRNLFIPFYVSNHFVFVCTKKED